MLFEIGVRPWIFMVRKKKSMVRLTQPACSLDAAELPDTCRSIVEALGDPNFMSDRSFNLPVWHDK